MGELVLFGAPWCAPCRSVKAALEGLEYRYVDVDEDPETAISSRVTGVPTLVAFRDGIEIGRVVQGVTLARALELQKMIQ